MGNTEGGVSLVNQSASVPLRAELMFVERVGGSLTAGTRPPVSGS